ncbi:class I adenylate-forming enzyme family protein [Gordonia humi]|uniref:Acyl-CoA synthetase (AMP-forming)/AMP-acid ligase II n=1 Tax=Gordonia humi TaxID=686429 RepID=A0A840ETY8_9ACTN|nr:AMP-binding protein [Gordonia humi]MBB4135162.1 acyl-CoA synthetase (AMP-forming)/AMP-acid ligase II [Gordonia humi]
MTISLILDMAASSHPDQTAITVDGESWTYSEFSSLCAGAGSVISASGAASVVFIGNSGIELATALFGSAHAGVPFVPVNYRLAPAQLERLVARTDDPLVIADPRYTTDLPSDLRLMTTEAFAARAAAADPAPAADVFPDDPAIVLFTSGTTSEPKGVILRHSHLLSYVMGTVEFDSAAATDGALISVPPYHIAGMGTILTNIYAGRRLIYLRQFDAEAWLTVARSEKATSAMVVPTMLERIVRKLDGKAADVPSLASLSYGGARMPLPTLEAALAAFPDTGFVNAYGLTETSSTIALLTPDDHRESMSSDDPAVRGRLGSIGRPVPGIEVSLRGPDGDEVRPGEQGELWVRGAQVSGEYMGIGSHLDADGWFPTKDLAFTDGDGYIFIVGRNDDTIIRGGENIAPAEIEDVLIHHPEVASTVVVGVPDDHWGQAIVAVIVPEPGTAPDADELREYVRSRLRGSRTPDRIAFVPDLPTTATGKILRRQIVSDLAEPRQPV